MRARLGKNTYISRGAKRFFSAIHPNNAADLSRYSPVAYFGKICASTMAISFIAFCATFAVP